MSQITVFPPSFPNAEEELFLKLILADRERLPELFALWKEHIIFDDIDFATLRLLPILYMRLREVGIVDDVYMGRIRGVYRMVWARNQRLLEATASIADTCRTNGIDVLLLKGLALLVDVYQDPGARFLGDGDILVKKADVPRVCTLLQACGWICTDPSVHLDDHFNYEGLFATTHALTFRNKNGVELEIHWYVFHVALKYDVWRMLSLRSLDEHAKTTLYWERARETELKGISVKMLSYEDMLVHVIVHGADGNDNHRTLRWVVDAAYILKHPSLDWDLVLKSTREGDHVVAMWYGITYLKERMNIDIPRSFMEKISQQTFSKQRHADYWRRSQVWYPPLGNFPLLWYRYWKFESQGSFLERARLFLPYLKQAWSISPGQSIIGFVCTKYCTRIARRFGAR